jgi:hypothetical protein
LQGYVSDRPDLPGASRVLPDRDCGTPCGASASSIGRASRCCAGQGVSCGNSVSGAVLGCVQRSDRRHPWAGGLVGAERRRPSVPRTSWCVVARSGRSARCARSASMALLGDLSVTPPLGPACRSGLRAARLEHAPSPLGSPLAPGGRSLRSVGAGACAAAAGLSCCFPRSVAPSLSPVRGLSVLPPALPLVAPSARSLRRASRVGRGWT